MYFDYSVLNGKIVEKYGSRCNFALAMKLSERSLSLKLNNKVGWKDREIIKAVKLLGIKKSDIASYFFNTKVQWFWIEGCENYVKDSTWWTNN